MVVPPRSPGPAGWPSRPVAAGRRPNAARAADVAADGDRLPADEKIMRSGCSRRCRRACRDFRRNPYPQRIAGGIVVTFPFGSNVAQESRMLEPVISKARLPTILQDKFSLLPDIVNVGAGPDCELVIVVSAPSRPERGDQKVVAVQVQIAAPKDRDP